MNDWKFARISLFALVGLWQRRCDKGDSIVKNKTVCNFIDTEKCYGKDYTKRGNYYCFIGRLSPEKE